MTDYEAYEKYCRSALTVEQIAKLHGVTVERMREIIATDGRTREKPPVPGTVERQEALKRLPEEVKIARQAFKQAGITYTYEQGKITSPEVRSMALKLISEGISPYAVAEALGCDAARVRKWRGKAKHDSK